MARNNRDKGLRLVVGSILLLIGLSGFGMISMMGVPYMFGMSGSWYFISVAVAILGGYLIYDSLKKE